MKIPAFVIALLLSCGAVFAAYTPGQTPPAPTALQQGLASTTYGAGFSWTPVTLPWVTNGSQTAFGGSIDTTSRLSVNPQGAAENGLAVKMPSGATGYAFGLKDSTGNIVSYITPQGGYEINAMNSANNSASPLRFGIASWQPGNAVQFTFGDAYNTVQSAWGCRQQLTCYHGIEIHGGTANNSNPVPFVSGGSANDPSLTLFPSASGVNLLLPERSGQTTDIIDFADSTNAIKAKIDSAYKATFPIVNATTAFQANGTAGLTTTLADGTAITGGIVTTAPTLVGTDTQTLRYNGTALVPTSNHLINAAGQTAFGGAIDTTSRVAVNPQGTSENGLTVNMPSLTAGNALQIKQGVVTTASLTNSGSLALNGLTVNPIGQTSSVSAVPAVTGATSYTYYVEAVNSGFTSGVTVASITNGPATLSNVNSITISWASVAGADSYRVYRGSGGPYFTVPSLALTFTDIGGAGVTNNGGADGGNYTGTISCQGINIGGNRQIWGSSMGHIVLSPTNGIVNTYAYALWGIDELDLGGDYSASLAVNNNNIFFIGTVKSKNSTTVGEILQSQSGQTADLMDFNTSTNAVGAKIDKNFNATFPAVLIAISTKTAAYTLTATDTTILMNGAFAVTLPAASATLAGHSWTVKQIGAASSTVVGTVDGNTAGYTLAAQYSFVTIITDGVAYYIVGKG